MFRKLMSNIQIFSIYLRSISQIMSSHFYIRVSVDPNADYQQDLYNEQTNNTYNAGGSCGAKFLQKYYKNTNFHYFFLIF